MDKARKIKLKAVTRVVDNLTLKFKLIALVNLTNVTLNGDFFGVPLKVSL